VLLIFMYCGKIKLFYLLKGLTPILFFLIFTFLMHLFLTKGGTTLFSWKFISIDSGGIKEGIFISMRLMFIMMASTIMTLTTN
ncbi:energy-coupling factor transporter transmembrane protein EcfT, partial [Staphylococcus epidermidis]